MWRAKGNKRGRDRESEREGEEELHNLLAKLESEEVVLEKFLNRRRERD